MSCSSCTGTFTGFKRLMKACLYKLNQHFYLAEKKLRPYLRMEKVVLSSACENDLLIQKTSFPASHFSKK